MKVRAEHGPVRERLADLGAESLGSAHQRDTYYDHPSRSFADTDEALRLRREASTGDGSAPGAEPAAGPDPESGSEPEDDTADPTTATLTYKGPLVDDASKTREEVETGVDDAESTDAVLRAVGFEPAAEVEKERERFVVGGYVVALDVVHSLGEFVEVEARAEGGTGDDGPGIDALRDGAFDLCRQLGLDPDDSLRRSYLALLLDRAG